MRKDTFEAATGIKAVKIQDGNASASEIVSISPDLIDPDNENASTLKTKDIKIEIPSLESACRLSGISLDSVEQLPNKKKAEKKVSCGNVLCNAIKYYNRILSVVFGCPAEDSWSRAGKALILATQAFMCISIVGIICVFERGSNSTVNHTVLTTFVAMRIVQLVFGLIKPISNSKMIYASSGLAICMVYVLCNAIVYIALDGDYQALESAKVSLLVEFAIWEMLLMPFVVAIAWLINPKVANYMKALAH